jgi:N-acetylmuramoyl-L-alanine amidase
MALFATSHVKGLSMTLPMRKLVVALMAAMPLLAADTAGTPLNSVTAVRHWSVGDVVRVAVEISGEFKIRSDRLHDPERVYFDILNARPRINDRRIYSEQVDGKLLKRLRVAETMPGITRVVLELGDGVECSTSELTNPRRLIIELRRAVPAALPAAPAISTAIPPSAILPPVAVPPQPIAAEAVAPGPAPPPTAAENTPAPATPAAAPVTAKAESTQSEASTTPITPAPELARSARHTASGQNSLTRALGLKINRIVIDPGHGGQDEGTKGAKGLLEKDLVLDVSKRLGKLIQDRMGAEVIYTRTDDTFVPLDGRTALANSKKADLFLSIHANSSPAPQVAGIETYYLNFTNSKEALDIAARENATAQSSVFELQDIIQKITQHDKAEESREFALRVQSALYGFSSRYNSGEKNRGVRKAPFVVLIGASMPSILAEIGFLSNPREEGLLRKPDYRQKLAEALFRGVSKYAESLSHYQVASN